MCSLKGAGTDFHIKFANCFASPNQNQFKLSVGGGGRGGKRGREKGRETGGRKKISEKMAWGHYYNRDQTFEPF